MYLPRRFAETDLSALDGLLARDPFVTLVTVDADGLPFASHLPVLYRRRAGQVSLLGHWARPNPQAAHSGPVLAIVHGPHAYVSPRWYADPEHQVPTWNYAVGHLRGALRRFDDSLQLQALVAELAAHFEASLGGDWRFPESAPGTVGELAGIVGFELTVERIELKFKLGQNHPPANIEGAAAGLAALAGQAGEVAELMRQRMPISARPAGADGSAR